MEWVLGEEASSWEGLKDLTDDNVLSFKSVPCEWTLPLNGSISQMVPKDLDEWQTHPVCSTQENGIYKSWDEAPSLGYWPRRQEA